MFFKATVRYKDNKSSKYEMLSTCLDKFLETEDKGTALYNLYCFLKTECSLTDFVITLTDNERTFNYTSGKLDIIFA